MIQWLDVVHQLIIQFPNQFQYTEKLLIFIADAVYSCQFGTFLGNCEKDREVNFNLFFCLYFIFMLMLMLMLIIIMKKNNYNIYNIYRRN